MPSSPQIKIIADFQEIFETAFSVDMRVSHQHTPAETFSRRVQQCRNSFLNCLGPKQNDSAIVDEANGVMAILIDLFQGRAEGYAAMDTSYHDLDHTLNVCLCWSRMVQGYQAHAESASLSFTHVRAGFYAALFHDCGYVKRDGDNVGTGAKFSFIHERRGCLIAEELLENLLPDGLIRAMQRIIGATGPRAVIEAIPFADDGERKTAQMLATADFLAQMGDPGYPERLQALYEEFLEAERSRTKPDGDLLYPTLESLVEQTPAFWHDSVMPRLDGPCEKVHMFLNEPYPDGPNPYIQQVLKNLDALHTR